MNKTNNENREWLIFDAKDAVLGRLSTQIANVLRGKSKTSFRNNSDTGDYAVVINAEAVKLTGNKEEAKSYHHHTGYLGHLKTTTLKELRATKPKKIIMKCVYGMLPKNKLRDGFMIRLKVYSGNTHPHVNIKFKNQ